MEKIRGTLDKYLGHSDDEMVDVNKLDFSRDVLAKDVYCNCKVWDWFEVAN